MKDSLEIAEDKILENWREMVQPERNNWLHFYGDPAEDERLHGLYRAKMKIVNQAREEQNEVARKVYEDGIKKISGCLSKKDEE